MYQRLTIPAEDGYHADGLMAIERLGRLEDVIDRLQKEFAQTQEAMDRLQRQGKGASAVYGQLRANKAQLQELLIRLGCL